MTDQEFFERRLAEELAAATASVDPRAAAAHRAMAQAYLLRVDWAGGRGVTARQRPEWIVESNRATA